MWGSKVQVNKGIKGRTGGRTIWITSCVPAALVKHTSPSGCPSLPNAVAVYMHKRQALQRHRGTKGLTM
jgi:hypothetical protein